MKKTPKKATKTSKKTKGKKLVNVPEEVSFRVCNGAILRNLQDLAHALETISEEEYAHHANEERNDFSSWVKDIFKEARLATSLRKAKSKSDAAKVVKNKLKK